VLLDHAAELAPGALGLPVRLVAVPGRMAEAGGGADAVCRVGDVSILGGREEHAGRLSRILVVVGNRFLYVRNREKDLPVATSLEALIAATKASREEIVAFLNCEFSTGRVRGGAVSWEILQSTLPWRETHHLDFVDEITTNAGSPAPRVVGANQWSVPVNTFSEGEIQALFAR